MKTQAILRTAFLAICMASAFTIKAQPEAGTFSLIPKAGISSASLTNVPVILVEDPDITITRSFFPGFSVGAAFAYPHGRQRWVGLLFPRLYLARL